MHCCPSPDLGKEQKDVLDALRFFPDATNAEIAARLQWPINVAANSLTESPETSVGQRSCVEN